MSSISVCQNGYHDFFDHIVKYLNHLPYHTYSMDRASIPFELSLSAVIIAADPAEARVAGIAKFAGHGEE